MLFGRHCLAAFYVGDRLATLVGSASDPISVALLCFSAQGYDQQVGLEWQTATELNTSGFYIMRSLQPTGNYQIISEFIFHCDDSGLVGGYYTFDDYGVTNGQAYYYKLVEAVAAQETVEYGPLMVIPDLVAATPTGGLGEDPVVPGAIQPTATWTASPTMTPSSTSAGQALATPTPSSTAAGSAGTATPTPTIQRQVTAAASEGTGTSSTNTPLPTATRRPVQATPTGMAAGDGLSPNPGIAVATATPQAVAQALNISPAEPVQVLRIRSLATPQLLPYPMPTLTLPPDAYVGPQLDRPQQLATMTPQLANPWGAQEPGAAAGPAPRVWLIAGFVLSMIILLAGLVALLRFGQRG